MVRTPIEHGTQNGYGRGCRCTDCTGAHAADSALRREINHTVGAINPGVIKKHGSRTTYVQWGCRCAECRKANVEYDKARRRRRAAEIAAALSRMVFTADTLPKEVVDVWVTQAGGTSLYGVADILNAYEKWRYEKFTPKEDQSHDRGGDAQSDAV